MNIDYEKDLFEWQEHNESKAALREFLDNRSIDNRIILKNNFTAQDYKGADLLVSLGGDGTLFLTGAQVLDNTPVLPWRSSGASYGAHLNTNITNFREHFDKILNHPVEELVKAYTRLQGKITYFGRPELGEGIIDHAVNDIFVGDQYSMGMARQFFDGAVEGDIISENQMSNGLIAAPPGGFSGWLHNIEGLKNKIPHPFDERLGQWGLESPKKNGLYAPTVREGYIHDGQIIKITSDMRPGDGCVSFDGVKPTRGPRCYDFPKGSTVEIGVSPHPLYVIDFIDKNYNGLTK